MELLGKRIAILAEDDYQEMELWYPLYRMREAGAETIVVGMPGVEAYHSKHGYPVHVDAAADAVSAESFDAVIIPGGYAPDMMRRYPAMVNLVSEAFAQGKVVAAICHAGWMLASANILEGRTVTSFFSIRDDLVHAGATFVDQKVVVDGKLITSRKPDDLPAFMKAVLSAL